MVFQLNTPSDLELRESNRIKIPTACKRFNFKSRTEEREREKEC